MTSPRRPAGGVRAVALLAGLAVSASLLTSCEDPAPPTPPPSPSSATATSATAAPTGAATPSPSPSGTKTSGISPPTPVPHDPAGTGDPVTSTSRSPSCAGGAAAPARLSLVGTSGRAFAFARLDRPAEVTVEGRVADTAAWSTSKVLVVAAYLGTVADGRPDRLSAEARRLVRAALSRSDAAAVTALRDEIPGRPGAAMTRVLRSVGDTTTVAPDSYQGTMAWSLREQVRFTAALDAGEVVSPAASRFLLESMQPIRAHALGLGTIGATAVKGGWLRQDRATRQLGIVDGYAVAISTDRGPAVEQTDGDAAHVPAMNALARRLRERLTYEAACR